MHGSSYDYMKLFVDRYLDPDLDLMIADVGSLDINGAYRPLFSKPGWKYVGIDLVSGPNVDLVVPDPLDYSNIEDKVYDVVVSGQTLEHVKYPYRWIKELRRILKPCGLICVITVWKFNRHEGPAYRDYWRVLPSGMRALFEEAGLRILEVLQGEIDTVGIGRRSV